MIALVIFSMLFCFITAAPNSAALTKAVTYDPIPKLKTTNIVAAVPTHVEVHEPTVAKVGEILENVPTAVSHQSSTIVHSRAQRLTPIVAPAMRSYTAPILRPIAATGVPIAEHTPPMWSSFFTGLTPAAAFVHEHVPYQLRAYNAVAPPYYGYSSYGLPLVYAVGK